MSAFASATAAAAASPIPPAASPAIDAVAVTAPCPAPPHPSLPLHCTEAQWNHWWPSYKAHIIAHHFWKPQQGHVAAARKNKHKPAHLIKRHSAQQVAADDAAYALGEQMDRRAKDAARKQAERAKKKSFQTDAALPHSVSAAAVDSLVGDSPPMGDRSSYG